MGYFVLFVVVFVVVVLMWFEADTKRMQAERARRKAAKEAEKQAKLEFKNRNK